MQLKLNRGLLVGNTWHERGSLVNADGKYAEQLVMSGAATPHAGTVEQATTTAPRSADRAVARPQR